MSDEGRTIRLKQDDIAWRQFGEEGILLDLRTSTYLSANPSATLLWSRLEQGATRDELVSSLVEHFKIDAERAGRDVDAFLGRCRDGGYLQEA